MLRIIPRKNKINHIPACRAMKGDELPHVIFVSCSFCFLFFFFLVNVRRTVRYNFYTLACSVEYVPCAYISVHVLRHLLLSFFFKLASQLTAAQRKTAKNFICLFLKSSTYLFPVSEAARTAGHVSPLPVFGENAI